MQNELQRQHENWLAVRGRIDNAKPNTSVQKIERLEGELACVRDKMESAQRKVTELTSKNSRLEKSIQTLALDNADQQAIIASQAQKIHLLTFPGGTGAKIRERPRDIIFRVLKKFPGITVDDITSPRRGPRLIEARHECVKAVFEQRPDLSFPQIGKIFSRDHTTIMHAVQKMGAKRA